MKDFKLSNQSNENLTENNTDSNKLHENFDKPVEKKPNDCTPTNPIFLTKKKLVIISLLIFILAFGGAFAGMTLYNSIYKDPKSAGSVTNDGYTLSKGSGDAKDIKQIASENLNSVVEIRTESVKSDTWLREYVTEGAGSGVIIKEDGYIITNNHVIENASKIYVTLASDKEYTASLIGSDSESDIAVIKIDAKNLPVVTYGNSDELSVGDMSVIIGNPLGELGGTVTSGIVSSLDREITLDGQPMTLLQTDASINPGNSGGGMFNKYGQLIGIVVAKSSGSGIEGLSFAIPINKAADVASQLIKNGKALSTKGYSGMAYQESANGQVYIYEVVEDFAQKSGFKKGDQVVAIDGKSIDSLSKLSETIKKYSPGDNATFTVIRNGNEKKIKIKLQRKN